MCATVCAIITKLVTERRQDIIAGREKVARAFAEYVQKLYEITERICKEEMDSFAV